MEIDHIVFDEYADDDNDDDEDSIGDINSTNSGIDVDFFDSNSDP